MRNFLKKLNLRLGGIIAISVDRSEIFDENPSFRWQIIKSIWNEPI